MKREPSALFSDLRGKIIHSICTTNSEEIIFTCSDGSKYRMSHDQDCCETVQISDICGDLGDLLNSPILIAEEATSDIINYYGGDQKWTFYKLSTQKGSVTIRWNGESNGYYSIDVSFVRCNEDLQ